MNILRKKYFKIAALNLCTIVIIYSALDKLFISTEKQAVFTNTEFAEYTILLGVCDLFLLALFLLSSTQRIGFIFSVCYYSAALSLRISVGASLIEPLAILVLLFTTMFLSDPGLFFHRQTKE
jgi:hypothetical protein